VFAPPVAKALRKEAEGSTGKLASSHSTFAAPARRSDEQFDDASARGSDQRRNQAGTAALSWDFSKLSIHAREAAGASRALSSISGKSSSVRGTLAESGHPLDATDLAYFQSSLGVDLSSVRLHTSATAADSAAALSARAYTAGRHIVLGRGEYVPGAVAGRHVLAHELAHIIQQSRGGPAGSAAGNRSLEASAAEAARRIARGERVAVAGSSGTGIARLSLFDELTAGKYSWPILNKALTHTRPVDTIVNDINALTSTERDQAIKDITAERTQQGRKLTDLNLKKNKQTDPSLQAVADPMIETSKNLLLRMDQVLDGISATIAISETATSLKAATVAPAEAQKPLIESALKPDLRPGEDFKEDIPGEPSYLPKLREVTASIIDTFHKKLAENKGPAEHKDATKLHTLSEVERIGNTSKRETDNIFGQFKKGPPVKADTRTSRGNIHDLWQATENRLKTMGPGEKREMARQLVFYIFQSRPQIASLNALHNADPKFGKDGTPVNTEAKEQKQVADDSTAAPEAVQRLNEIDRAWPAEERGGEQYIQLFKKPDEASGPLAGSNVADRDLMWEIFQTLVHEYIHTLAHPAYNAYAESFGDGSSQYNTLVEGADSFLDEVVWSSVAPRVTDKKLREEVEGPAYSALPAMTVKPASSRRYQSYSQVLKLVNIVGVRNLYAAYFLGDVKKIKG